MDFLVLILSFLIFFCAPLAAIVWAFKYYGGGGQGRAIQKKFQAAGNLRGKTFEQICRISGKPLKATDYPNGKKVAIFGSNGWNITLIFQNGICQGVSSETSF